MPAKLGVVEVPTMDEFKALQAEVAELKAHIQKVADRAEEMVASGKPVALRTAGGLFLNSSPGGTYLTDNPGQGFKINGV